MSYVDFEKICNVINNFPGLNQKFVTEDITFPLLYSSSSIKFQKQYIDRLKIYMDKIDTRTYHEFTVDKRYLSEDWIFIQKGIKLE